MGSCIEYLQTCPSQGDGDVALLGKILQVLNSGGGGIAGVSSLSVNGGAPQTGAVSITTGGTVTSVNGDPGPAVSLDSGEIPEGANLYFTESRVRATVLTGFASALGAITAADSVLSAFGKAQGRLAALEAGTAGPFLLRAGDTGTGAFLFTPAAVDVVPLTLTSAVGSATTSSLFVATGGATNRLTIRNDGRFILAGRILATNTDVLGNTLNFSDAGTANAPILLALGHTSTAGLGTAAAGFGAMLDWNLDSTTTLATRAVRETAAWTVATHATRTASLTFFAFTGGSETIQLTLTNNQVQGGDGTVALPTFTTRNAVSTGWYFPTATSIASTLGGTEATRITTTSFASASAFALGATSATPDVFLRRDAAAILALSNTTVAAQTFRITETTDAGLTNYSRLSLQTQAGNHLIRTEAAGTGVLRTFQVGTGPVVGANVIGVNTIVNGGQSTGSAVGGAILFQANVAGGAGSAINALTTFVSILPSTTVCMKLDIANAGTAFANTAGFEVANIDATTNNWTGILFADAVGAAAASAIMGAQLKDRTNHYGDFAFGTRDTDGLLERFRIRGYLYTFGGITSSFPALKRSSATLQVRLADDSAFAALSLAGITQSVAATFSVTSGANQRAGNATLVVGTVTVSNTTVTANTIVIYSRKTSGGTIGTAMTYTTSAGASFTLTSDSALDTSTFSYFLIEVP